MSVRSGFQASTIKAQNRVLCNTKGSSHLTRRFFSFALQSGKLVIQVPGCGWVSVTPQLFFTTAHGFTFRPGSCDVSCCHVDLAFDLVPPLARVVRFWRIQPLVGLALAELRT